MSLKFVSIHTLRRVQICLGFKSVLSFKVLSFCSFLCQLRASVHTGYSYLRIALLPEPHLTRPGRWGAGRNGWKGGQRRGEYSENGGASAPRTERRVLRGRRSECSGAERRVLRETRRRFSNMMMRKTSLTTWKRGGR